MSFPSSTETTAIEWIVPDFILSWSDPSCDWTLKPYRRTFASGELTALSAGRVYGFLMVAPARELSALTFDFAGPMRAAGLWVELCTVDGTLLRRAAIGAAAIQGYGQAPVMDLTGLRFEIGAKLHVHLSVVALDDSAEVYVAATPQPATGVAFHRQMARLHNERAFIYDRPAAVAAVNVVVFPQGATLAETTPALKLLAAAFPSEDFTGVYAEKASELWPVVETAEVVAFADFHRAAHAMGADYDRLCFELNRRGICTLAVDTQTLEPSPVKDGPVARTVKAAIEDQQRCRFILRSTPVPALCGADRPLEALADAPALGANASLPALKRQVQAAMLPKVAIIAPVDSQAVPLQAFLERIRLQTYPGQIVTVLAGDGPADVPGAEAFQQRLEAFRQDNRSVRVLSAPAAGKARPLIDGVEAEQAAIYVVLDRASLINRDFVAAHVFEHAQPGVQVVAGRPAIEAGDRDPDQLLRALEQDPALVEREGPSQPGDIIEPPPRIISIKRQTASAEGLFDPDLRDPSEADEGLGWASAELAYRLYARGAPVRFTDKAFCVRAARPGQASHGDQAPGAMRTFEKLFAKHENMALVARRWAVSTFDSLAAVADQRGVAPDDVRLRLETRFAEARQWQAPLIAVMRGRRRRLRVLSYRWHGPHQYELYKLPHDFTLATGVGDNGMVERWPYEQRPLRANARLKPASEIDPADYDVALLHFDENVLAPELCNNTIPAAWGDPFHWLLQTDLPKVGICHGTPQFVGQYGADGQRKSTFTLHEDERLRLVALLSAAGVHVVCNSHQAHAEWGFASSQVIWHGFDPQEFPEGRGDLDVLALDADPHRPHYRGAWEQIEVEARLNPTIRIENARHFGGALEVRGTNPYARAHFQAYVERIGRFKAYLNTTLRSPMPRSRGEAMMTGVVPVCLDNHDVSRFIENGVDGFFADEPAALADFLNHLCGNEGEARRMRAAARRKALDLFNHDRYLAAWAELLERVST
jgi:hypothetical protein